MGVTYVNWDGIVAVIGRVAFLFLNIGILLGLSFGVLILLRPVTNRIIAPKWRVWIWFIGWYGGFLTAIMNALLQLQILPLTLPDLVIPRVHQHGYSGMPAFLPEVVEYGSHTILLPGGAASIPVNITQGTMIAVAVLWLAITIVLLNYTGRQERKLRRISRQGEKLSPEERAKYGIKKENVAVRRCKGLPTSFVRFGNDEGWGDGIRFVICIQEELPEEQLRLVLLHEMEHIYHHHVWWKSIISTIFFCFYWWNPVLWVAYRLTCRDMELACDQSVMEKLNGDERREYAHLLVDLGAGKHMWSAATSFGECDAALRVRRVVTWRSTAPIEHILGVGLSLLLTLFLFTSGTGWNLNDRIQGMDMSWYLHSPMLEQQMEQRLGRDVEYHNTWFSHQSTQDKSDISFWVELKDGTWHFCTAQYGDDGFYYLDELQSFDLAPDLSKGGWHSVILYVD